MCTDKEKLEKLQNKFAKFEKEITDFADTLEFVMETKFNRKLYYTRLILLFHYFLNAFKGSF